MQHSGPCAHFPNATRTPPRPLSLALSGVRLPTWKLAYRHSLSVSTFTGFLLPLLSLTGRRPLLLHTASSPSALKCAAVPPWELPPPFFTTPLLLFPSLSLTLLPFWSIYRAEHRVALMGMQLCSADHYSVSLSYSRPDDGGTGGESLPKVTPLPSERSRVRTQALWPQGPSSEPPAARCPLQSPLSLLSPFHHHSLCPQQLLPLPLT